MRLFVGWPLPSELAYKVTERVGLLEGRVPSASWTRTNLHLTFAFIGETDDAIAASVMRSIAELRHAAIDVDVSGVGAFPTPRRPRVVWLGLEPVEPIERLAATVRDAIRDAGAAFDEKRFVPHVTLARTRAPWSSADLERVTSALELVRGASAQLDRVVLFRSRLSPRGAVHEAIAEAALTRSD